jgi:dTDP-4-amino-4,6-dideoxygalactose transaminase
VASSWPIFADDEIEAAVTVLKTGRVNYWTGEEVKQFETEFAAYTGCRHALAVANGTVALELALHALGIGSADEVIVPSRTFIATASAVVASGAVPVVADVDRDSQNISAATIGAVLSPRTRCIIVVHLAGWPCDMSPILELAESRGLYVIEDCAQAHGACYQGRHVGSVAHIGAFSFCQDKIMTTAGEGGMITCNDGRLWERAWSYKDHGKNYQAVNAKPPTPGFRWVHDSFGTNWRLTEVQAAIGRVQLRKLDDWVACRRRNASVLRNGLREVRGLHVPNPPADTEHAYYKFYSYVVPERLRSDWNRDRVMQAINDEGIACFSGVCAEIYREVAFTSNGLGPAQRLPNAMHGGETSLMFQVDPTLDAADMEATAAAVRKVMESACLE